MVIEKYISKQSQEKINARVRECESKVNAEVVTFFMVKSNRYEEAPLRAFLIGLVFAVAILVAYEHYNGWYQAVIVKDELLALSIIFGVGSVFYLLTSNFIFLQRLLVGASKMEESTMIMQHSIFSEYNLQETSQRNAILIFVSFFEKHISIKTDTYFTQKINNSEWDAIINEQIPLLKNKQYEQAFINTIAACEKLLLQHGIFASVNKDNELTNDLRINN